ncbi:hypothetical protein PHYPSEUDO_002277 [Phytophthora pseudosyringae]|uniref:Uncharacterized protein n=1 Tax=Phytophthora pseudosyringae TaxID=221518 RepID=A0A8T1VWX5_9STRA|nr:hypothetical protein PHYPSEUDO_002277 [Phytophthora pseudosyringae]
MPKKNKRLSHISALACVRRSRDRHQSRLAELVGVNPTGVPSPPTPSVPSDDTSSEENGEDFQGSNLYTFDLIYAKTASPACAVYYFVAWVGGAWRSAADLPQAERQW